MALVILAPPPDGSFTSITANGRLYSCDPGKTISVPDFDAFVMLANGWQRMQSMAVGLVSTSSGSALTLDPETGDVFQDMDGDDGQ